VTPGSLAAHPGWMIVVYIFAGLFALELVLLGIVIVVSS
jgi:hypothetical protein